MLRSILLVELVLTTNPVLEEQVNFHHRIDPSRRRLDTRSEGCFRCKPGSLQIAFHCLRPIRLVNQNRPGDLEFAYGMGRKA